MFKFSNQADDKVGKEFYHYANQLYPHAQKELGFEKPCSCVLTSDPENAQDPLGYTAYYNPEKAEIVVFSDGRHIKDMLRSFSHELVHHAQHCRGDLGNHDTPEGYAQKDPHMREMEREAYEKGNLIFRDWEDGYKKHLKEKLGEKDYTGSTKVDQHNIEYYSSRGMDPNAEKHHQLDVDAHNQVYNNKETPWMNKFEESQNNVTYYTAQNYDANTEKHHQLNVMDREQAHAVSPKPYIRENNPPPAISDEFKQEILSYLNLDNPNEAKKNWIGTAQWDGGEVSYFWVRKNKLFYLVEFSPTYGVDIKNVFGTWMQVNGAGLRKLRQSAGNAEITTFKDKRR